MTATVILCGIGYRVQRADEDTVVFSQEAAIGGRPTRFVIARDSAGIWEFSGVDGWGDAACCHIESAYRWVLANVGQDHARPPQNSGPVVEHRLAYDDARRMTYCRACGQDLSPLMQWVSCGGVH